DRSSHRSLRMRAGADGRHLHPQGAREPGARVVIRWKKAATIARFELVSTVRRLGYLVVTRGRPLFAIVCGALALTPGYLALRTIEQGSTYGVVDHSGLLRLAPGDKLKIDKATFRVYESEQAATRALRDKRGIKSF